MPHLPFNTPSPETPEGLSKVFNMPAGDMMEKLGILSAEQVAESGRKQTLMLAVRNTIKAGNLSANDPRLPQFKGSVDFLALASKSEEELVALQENLGIHDVTVHAATEAVGARKGVNEPGEKLPVPFIGMIHNKLYGNAALSQASLAVQQAIRASETALRLQDGNADPTAHGKKREFSFKNNRDDQRVKDAVALHEKLSTRESTATPGEAVDVSAEKSALAGSFADAAAMFAEAGKPEIAEKVKQVARYYDQKVKTAPAPGNDPAPGQ